MTRIIFLLCILLIGLQSLAQNATIKKNSDYRKTMVAKGKEDVLKLKNGVLLVRIHGRTKEIAHYKKHGRSEMVERLEKETMTFNQNLISAFNEKFKFCPIYFFEDTFSLYFTSGRINDVIFYDDSLKPDASIQLNNSNYFFAEIGFTEGDTTRFRNEYMITSNEEGTHQETRMHSEENLHLLAFVIRDKNFVMLHEPFPSYERLYKKQPKAWKLRKKISIWNSRITNYYGGS
ncbi:MAG: hypothetical protein ACK47F_11105 [Flavobacteriales bacterium]